MLENKSSKKLIIIRFEVFIFVNPKTRKDHPGIPHKKRPIFVEFCGWSFLALFQNQKITMFLQKIIATNSRIYLNKFVNSWQKKSKSKSSSKTLQCFAIKSCRMIFPEFFQFQHRRFLLCLLNRL